MYEVGDYDSGVVAIRQRVTEQASFSNLEREMAELSSNLAQCMIEKTLLEEELHRARQGNHDEFEDYLVRSQAIILILMCC